MKIWIQAARPKTLSAAWVPVLATTALVHSLGLQWRWDVLVFALVSSLSIQVATNFFNDVIDFKKGADTSRRLGPTRVSAAGLLRPEQVWRAALAMAVLAIAAGAPLVVIGGWPIVLIGVAAVALTYGYTGGPWPLAYLGLGDFFVLLFFGWIASWGTAFLEVGYAMPVLPILVLGSQIGLWATALIAINNARDAGEDRVSGKMTMAARFGLQFSRLEISFCLLAPFLLGFGFWGVLLNRWGLALLPAMVLPLAIRVVTGVCRTVPSREWNRYLAQAGAMHALTGLLLTLGGFLS